MTETAICGWDIGGAHLKYVSLDQAGRVSGAQQLACPLWRGTEHLVEVINKVEKQSWTGDTRHAVTMTGELCDNFQSRSEGVREILDVVRNSIGDGRTQVYAGEHGWFPLGRAKEIDPGWIASANWRAMAEVVALAYENAILLDIGSTTTDIVPIINGHVANRGDGDQARLGNDELVYTGVVRTPLMSLARNVPVAGSWQRIAAEHFATTADIYRILDLISLDADLHDTADGAGKSVVESVARLSRMLGHDRVSLIAAKRVSEYFMYCQFDVIQRALLNVVSRLFELDAIVVAGAGAFLARRLCQFNAFEGVDFDALLPRIGVDTQLINTCAPAAAVAKLAFSTR